MTFGGAGLSATRQFVSDTAGALRDLGVPDWNISLARYSPGTLYSNPLPLQFERIGAETATNTITSTVGRNVATWTVDALGNPLGVTGTLKESFSGATRSAAEAQAQADAAATAKKDHHG